jgi:hypothetical protein
LSLAADGDGRLLLTPANPAKRPFFKCTISNEIAAGVTPDMREA